MADALHTPGVTSAAEARLDDMGLIAAQSGLLVPRTGVLWGPGSTALVTGTASTAPMRVSVAAHHWVTTRQAADGVYRGTMETTTLLDIGAAPGSGTRTDVVYVKQGDANSTVTPDGATAPVYGVLAGVAGAGKPNLATIVGAEEIATVAVSPGATATNGANVVITNTGRQTVARGADIPVRSQAERDALATFPLLTVKRLDTGRVERRNLADTAWETVFDPAYAAWTTLVQSANTYTTAVSTVGYTDLAGYGGLSSAVVPTGRTLDVEYHLPRLSLAAGGSDVGLKLLLGGAVVDTAEALTVGAGAPAMSMPIKLAGSVVGTGAAVTIAVQAWAAAGSATANNAATLGPRLRYRIL